MFTDSCFDFVQENKHSTATVKLSKQLLKSVECSITQLMDCLHHRYFFPTGHTRELAAE